MDVLYSDESISVIQSLIDANDPVDAEPVQVHAVQDGGDDGDDCYFRLEAVPAALDLEITTNFNLKDMVATVRKVTKAFHYLSNRKDTLDKHVKEDHGKILGMLTDCKTR